MFHHRALNFLEGMVKHCLLSAVYLLSMSEDRRVFTTVLGCIGQGSLGGV